MKFRDSKLVSQHFPITHIHQTVLRMDKGVSIVLKFCFVAVASSHAVG